MITTTFHDMLMQHVANPEVLFDALAVEHQLAAYVSEEAVEKFDSSLKTHIAYVQEAGRKLGVPESQLEIHDKSKYVPIEYFPYAKHFFGGGAKEDFAIAWLHHLHNNPHHPEFWCSGPDQVYPMPGSLALEMVADWMGANMAYQGTWDMSEWLKANFDKKPLHPETRRFVVDVLRGLGYTFLFNDS